MKNASKYLLSIPLFLLGVLVLWIFTAQYVPVLENTWHLLTGRGYEIPEGSSIFSFRPTVMNSDSGEWWLYGEDGEYYYYLDSNKKISKESAKKCRGFKQDDHITWCEE